MMERKIVLGKMMRLLAAALWAFGLILYPLRGETAPPIHPMPSAPENAADRVWTKVKNETPSGEKMPEAEAGRNEATVPEQDGKKEPLPDTPAAAVKVPAGTLGYTEAEIREQMIRKHTPSRPDFRLVSGAFVGSGYRPGTMDVKIPVLFFPPNEIKDVSETFLENPDGTFGTKAPEGNGNGPLSYGAEAQKQLAAQAGSVKSSKQLKSAQPEKQEGAAAARQKYKTITVQVPVPAPSPFRPLAAGDFRWYTNSKGHYVVALPVSMPYDPLQKLPALGPALLRNASQKEFMAVTTDDPEDTYYYKNQDTFPDYGKTVPLFTETRKNIQGDNVNIKYIRRYIGGDYCLIVDSSGKRGNKTYRTAVVFPESKQYEYLPKALYMIETLKGI